MLAYRHEKKKTTKEQNTHGRVCLFSSNPSNPSNPSAHNVAVHPFESLGGKKAVALEIGELVGTCQLPVLTPFLLLFKKKRKENLLQVTRGDFSCKLQDEAKPSRRINIETFFHTVYAPCRHFSLLHIRRLPGKR